MKHFAFISLLILTNLAEAQISRKGEFTVQIEFVGKAQKYPEVNTWHATISTKGGKKLYEVSKSIPFDVGYPAVYVSDQEGRSAIVSSLNGTVEFYGSTGDLVRTLRPFRGGEIEEERIVRCSVAGTRAAFLISAPGMKHPDLLFTDLQGNELWRRTLGEKHAGEVFLSDDTRYILAATYSTRDTAITITRIFDVNGRVRRSLNTLFRVADVDTKNGRVALGYVNDLVVAAIGNTRAMHRWGTGVRDRLVTNVKFFGDFVAASVEGLHQGSAGQVYSDPALVIFNQECKVLKSKTVQASGPAPSRLVVAASRVELHDGQVRTSIDLDELVPTKELR